MDKEKLRQRMLDAELPEEVVDELMSSMKDEDFARMKDMTKEQILEALREGGTETPEPKVVESKEPVIEESDDGSLMETFKALGAYVANVVKETLENHTMEIEIPALTEIQTDIAALKEGVESFKEISKIMKDMLTSDEQRLQGLVRDMSQASRNRLRHSLDDAGIVKRVVKMLKEKGNVVQQAGFRPSPGGRPSPGDSGFQPIVRDAQGKTYANLADMIYGDPIPE